MCPECRGIAKEMRRFRSEALVLERKMLAMQKAPALRLVFCRGCNTMIARGQFCREACRYNGVTLKSRPSGSLGVKRFYYTGEEKYLPSKLYGQDGDS